jgi:uncharacterized protein
METRAMNDTTLRDFLQKMGTVAIVGASANPERPSHFVGEFLRARGLRVIGVNPGLAGQMLYGAPVVARLADIDADIPVDTVDIFRRSEEVPAIVEEAIAHLPRLRGIWMQIGVQHDGAAKAAMARGLQVVQNRCPKVEFPRLLGA